MDSAFTGTIYMYDNTTVFTYSDVTTIAFSDVTTDYISDITDEGQDLIDLLLLITLVCEYLKAPLAILGCICNILSSIILFPRARKSSSFNYLFTISVLDTVHLLATNIGFFVHSILGINPMLYVPCSLMYLLVLPTSQLSSWALVLCCVERALVIYHPHKAKIWFNPQRARLAMFVTTIVLSIFNWHLFGGIEYAKKGTVIDYSLHDSCVGRNDLVNDYMKVLYPGIDLFLYSCIPGAVLIATNGAIMVKYLMVKRAVGIDSDTSIALQKHGKKITILAVALATLFIITTMPIVAVNAAYQVTLMSKVDPIKSIKLYTVFSVTYTFSIFNHCANLLVYVVFGKMLRQDFINLLRACFCCCRNQAE